MRRALMSLVMGAVLAISTPAVAGPSEDLDALLKDHWQWVLKHNPTFASSVGVHRYDDQLGDVSLAARDRELADEKRFLARLEAIPETGLSEEGRIDKAVLHRILSDDIEGNGFGQRTVLFTSYSSPWQGLAWLATGSRFDTEADFANYLTRLSKFPAQNAELLKITQQAVAQGYVQPCVALDGFAGTISGLVAEDPTESRFYEPFAGPRPGTISVRRWQALQARAKTVITDVLNPEFRKAADYIAQDYMPHCAKTAGVSAQPDGKRYYAYRARVETTTDYTPAQIHRIGLDEIARIDKEMEAVAKQAGYDSRDAFIDHLRTDPQYYAETPEELLARSALIAKTIDGHMPELFGRLARLPYGIKPIPAETAEGTTTAYYSPGSPQNGVAGTYYVNTSKLDQRPFWEMPSLTMHEAVPGHHQQIALQQELDLPPMRRYLAHFTAFTEGWALYAETLGDEIGMYDTPAKRMGRLSYDAWRAARLVVDTGIHSMGWSKEKAVAFMKAHTALSDANIDAEVNRYISWPGQALAYKIGELRIRALRRKAERELGDDFRLRAFHDAVLEEGSLPLDVLEAHIDRWIVAQKAEPAASES
ncbi:DUF885 domain-containing protein [Stakelama saccharophila]|uniref:DUF885 domain-containing protein n=1 Tax=Stakelama saccharophila TaxID=3075605 RepID=A0ABZ0BB95_9SPHN|nr:DUF885 domain-containing protein [Stakelama sp. W311]WNO54552.1 DUF885 domain-containing protein [Stakelama sp. W311]